MVADTVGNYVYLDGEVPVPFYGVPRSFFMHYCAQMDRFKEQAQRICERHHVRWEDSLTEEARVDIAEWMRLVRAATLFYGPWNMPPSIRNVANTWSTMLEEP